MQKKVIATLISGAFAGAAGVASAGPISVASVTTYASEAIAAGGSSVSIVAPALAYTVTNPVAVGSNVVVRLSVDSGSLSGCPALTFSGTAGAVVTVGAGAVSGSLNCDYAVTTATAPIPSNATANFAAGMSVSGASSLATAGGALNATVAVRTSGGSTVESNSTAIANSAAAFTYSLTSSSAYTTAETRRIDVAALPPNTAFTAASGNSTVANTVNLGRVRVSDTAGTQFAPDGVTPVDLSTAGVQRLSLTVTGTFAATSATFLSNLQTCGTVTASLGGNTSAVTVASANIIDALSSGAGANRDIFICYQDTGTGAIPTSQFAVSAASFFASTVSSAFTVSSSAATGSLYNLTLNGTQIDIRNYVPDNTFGWVSAYRIINTGAVAAAVTGQFINIDGTLGSTAAAITASIPSGGVAVVSAAQIEAALGATTAPGGVGPRLRLTASTDSLRVQAFACQPNGNCFLNSDAMGVDAGGTTQTNDAR